MSSGVYANCDVCNKHEEMNAASTGAKWCSECFEAYSLYVQVHPIPKVGRPQGPFRLQGVKHMPAYMYPPAEWPTIGFKPEDLDPFRKGTTMNQAAPTPQQQFDPAILEQMVREQVAALGSQLMGSPVAQAGAAHVTVTAEDIKDLLFNEVDPKDSEITLVLFDYLQQAGRIQKVGSLNGHGYLYLYAEPKGSTKEGYSPGATQGDRMVDAALDKAKETGATPVEKGMCGTCFSIVKKADDGTVVLDATDDPTCPNSVQGHTLLT